LFRSVIFAAAFLALGALLGYALVSLTVNKAVRPPPPGERPAVKQAVALPPAVSASEKTPAPAPETPALTARVAIVLDDWGYNLRSFEAVKNIDSPLVLAVLPDLPYTKKIAQGAYEAGHEIILHMPMEPDRDIPLEKKTLKTGMDADLIRTYLEEAIDALPHIRGVSNHMGSKFTEDESAMRVALEAVQSRGCFFLDSVVTEGGVAGKIAAGLTLPYLERDVFLDNEREEGYIRSQLGKLKQTALSRGYAIGIGHDDPVTVHTIAKVLPEWEKEGVRLVKLSDILEYRKEKQKRIEIYK